MSVLADLKSIDHPRHILRHSLRRPRHSGRQRSEMHDRSNLAILRALAPEQPPQKRGHHGPRSALLRPVLDLFLPTTLRAHVVSALALRRQDRNHATVLRGAIHMGSDGRSRRGPSVLHPQQHHQWLVDRLRLLLDDPRHHRRQRHLRGQHG